MAGPRLLLDRTPHEIDPKRVGGCSCGVTFSTAAGLAFHVSNAAASKFPTETEKAETRRDREGWFRKHLTGPGIDIGWGHYAVRPDCQRFDREDGDAHDLGGVLPNSFSWVYSSHLLEHLEHPVRALVRWWDVLTSGGRLVLSVPHRDLYEMKETFPSAWNATHLRYFLPERHEPPATVGLIPLVADTLPDAKLVSVEVVANGYIPGDVASRRQPRGEFSIEGVWRKP